MRLWSLHPRYLDTPGLLAAWRESLLAQKVLKGKTRGYKNHPQLARFKKHAHPRQAIAAYLAFLWEESEKRGYRFNKKKIGEKKTRVKIPVTREQVLYEFKWLCGKLKKRCPVRYRRLMLEKKKEKNLHPLFELIEGPVEDWEKI